MSTSFSVASCTEQMTDSSEGLMTSNVLPSVPFTNSLLMKLFRGLVTDVRGRRSWHCLRIKKNMYNLQTSGLGIFTSVRCLELDA
jgi:hypothetical protein